MTTWYCYRTTTPALPPVAFEGELNTHGRLHVVHVADRPPTGVPAGPFSAVFGEGAPGGFWDYTSSYVVAESEAGCYDAAISAAELDLSQAADDVRRFQKHLDELKRARGGAATWRP